MMPFAESFVIHSQAVVGQDGDGNDVYGPTDTTVRGAFAPSGSTELVQGETMVLEHDTLYLVEGSAVPKPTDTVTVRGTVRQIDGMPADYRSPLTGWHPGPVVRLLKVT